MTNKTTSKKLELQRRPLRWLDLDIWRTDHGLDVSEARMVFGIPLKRWLDWQKEPQKPIKDATICILFAFYEAYPEKIPFKRPANFSQFMPDLDYEESEKRRCASALGREGVAAYRVLKGTPFGKSVERLMDAVQSLPLSATEKRQELEKLANQAAKRMGVSDPLTRYSWRLDK